MMCLRPIRAALVLICLSLSISGAIARDRGLLVFAAASQRDALEAVVAAWDARNASAIRTSYAASSMLARQIANGAPADIFISANPRWMDYLQERGRIDTDSRVDLLSNTLVLIAPKASPVQTVTLSPGLDLIALLAGGRLAVGDPAHVPAGIYARAALENLGLWETLVPNLARAADVRVALAFVARGETPLGIVYGSDAAAEPAVRVIGTFPLDSHPRIVYPAARVMDTARAETAGAFLDFLQSPEASAIFRRFGFAPLAAPDAAP